jgi:AbrB family looped-hinge helix DNA binding protein
MSKPIVEVVRVGKRGELTLPRRVRNSLRLQEGDELVLTMAEHRVILERRTRHFGTYLEAINVASGGRRDDD